MNQKLRAVVIGAAHVHILEVCKYLNDCPDMVLASVADPQPMFLSDLESIKPYSRRWNMDYVRRYGVKIYEDYRQMLDEVQPDLAFITTENQLHVEIFRECAHRGIVTSIEKPLACNYGQAMEIQRIARSAGVEVFVNWPIAWRQWLYQMKEVLDSGQMGKLIKIRYLVGQTGPLGPGAVHRGTSDLQAGVMTSAEKAKTWWYQSACGGGAFLDMCCYGSMMSVWLTGQDCQAVTAIQGNFVHSWSDVEDNGVMLLRFMDSVSVVEGTWTTPAAAILPGPEIFCRKGVISCERRERGAVVKLVDIFGNIEYLDSPAEDPNLRNIAWAFAAYKLRGHEMPPVTRLENNLKTMAIMDAGLRSVQSSHMELVNNAVWG